ncbi:hypothetical protein C8F04DRAFT_1249138 [Mycena alexandri]|uniref:X-box-binding protein 1 n=1 Tax=Mycena alexandri TaxID=1745969 RepID=A0AAD6XF69_9AGAR|nr:hypothetical protein C8F04DRAFT_1249138 [Mycena alexandri]
MSVNPSSLSMDDSPSPRPESPEPGPSRKRPRTSSSSEDRKEARAHRNRIAAQNSRDRRKAQFSFLERRVSELEEENRQLRAGLLVAPPRPEQAKAEEQDRELAKDRENKELRERIRTLEEGWAAVMKALAAQGLSTATAASAAAAASLPSPQSESQSPAPTAAPESPTPEQQSTDSPSPTFPTTLEPTMTFPISPAPSHNSLDFDLDLSSSPSFITGGVHRSSPSDGPAAGGLDLSLTLPGVSSADDSSASPEENTIDDATMEDLFREILASPRSSPTSLSFDAQGSSPFQATSTHASPTSPFASQVTADDILGLEGLVGTAAGDAGDDAGNWTGELEVDMLEMDRILGMLPAADAAAFPQTLEDLGLGLGWGDMENLTTTGGESALVGVF